MKFGPIAVGDAVGAVLAHTTRAGERVLKKGRVLSAADVEALAQAGLPEVICARLEPGELDENAAAAAVGSALAGDAARGGIRIDDAHTGRCNLHAAIGGLVEIDRAAIEAANAIDEAITVATVAPYAAVRAGDMIATVKIIPFSARADHVAAAGEAARGAVAIRPWRARRAGLVLTRFAETPDKLLERATEAQRTRVERCGAELAAEVRVSHEASAVAGALGQLAGRGIDPILVLGASAIIDRRDVIPTALVQAGGAIERLGMPVDPGNLLLLGRLGGSTVIGVPGCARSLKRSGFDAVLERTCAGLPIAGRDIAEMGVGGLLDEISIRPTPRVGEPAPAVRTADEPRVAAIVLAAGRANRMGSNKLIARVDGEPIVRRTVTAALASQADPVVVVTGHEAEAVREALAGLEVVFAHNPDYAAGMSTSLRAGLAAVGAVDNTALPFGSAASPGGAGLVDNTALPFGLVDAALVCLGDMPRLAAHHLDAVIAAYRDGGSEDAIIVPTCERKRGNPVLWPRRYFAEISALTGDVGARALIDRYAEHVSFLAIDDPAILLDVDTPAALEAISRGDPRPE